MASFRRSFLLTPSGPRVTLSTDSCTYGVPSVRTDLPLPRVKRVGDSTNYGDVATAAALLHPSVYHRHGVDEEQLLRPRSRKEVDLLLVSSSLWLDLWLFNLAEAGWQTETSFLPSPGNIYWINMIHYEPSSLKVEVLI